MQLGFTVPIFEDPLSRDPYRLTYDLCRRAEAVGFSHAFIGHHHFTPGFQSAPFVFLAGIAAHTSTLQLGTAVYLLPLHHPVLVAEEVATLDRLSGGRALLGIGTGYRQHEYDGLDAPFHRRGARLEEWVDVVRSAWTGASATSAHHGRQLELPLLEVLPPPRRPSGPPIWIGGVARAAIERAGRIGDGWIADSMQTRSGHVRRAATYRAAAEASGRTPTVCLVRNAAVGPHGLLEETWLPAAAEQLLAYWRAGARSRDDAELAGRLEAGQPVTLGQMSHDRAIVGTPDDCVAELMRYREGLDPDLVVLWFDSVRDPAEARRMIDAFGADVLPAIVT
jgi:alkanesulfonate monooxygenase SsuD/methylene tetrahydromethanopterin reductase-like flavin-dependent oxidoreductase (luciferase family)